MKSPDLGVRQNRLDGGFTLIELVMVIIIVGILAGVVAPLIARPTAAFIAETRRGALVDTAETALDRISREIRLAVPNSVRIDASSRVVEFLRTLDGGRYRASDIGRLIFSVPSPGFDVIGNLSSCTSLDLLNIATTCAKESACYVVVGNQGAGTGNDAFNGDNLGKIQYCAAGLALNGDGSDHLFVLPAKKFSSTSPNQRFQIVDTPVTYLCDPAAGTLRRYDGYTITANQANVGTDAELSGLSNPAESSLMADNVSACQFTFDSSATSMLTASLTITRDGESITLSKKIRVENQK
jgi:MSHA biogenesis protein MshO